MSSDMTVSDFADMSADREALCEVWKPTMGTVFNGSFNEAKECEYSDYTVDNFSIEDGIFVMNI